MKKIIIIINGTAEFHVLLKGESSVLEEQEFSSLEDFEYFLQEHLIDISSSVLYFILNQLLRLLTDLKSNPEIDDIQVKIVPA